jgi:hypothetical protein
MIHELKILGSNLYFDLSFVCILVCLPSQVSLQVLGHQVLSLLLFVIFDEITRDAKMFVLNIRLALLVVSRNKGVLPHTSLCPGSFVVHSMINMLVFSKYSQAYVVGGPLRT